MNPAATVLEFMNRINQRDADRLAELMTEDHVFIDSIGQAVHGRETMRTGWRGYFALGPDYRISHDQILQDGNVAAIFGEAGGTIAAADQLPAENRWRTPAAWRAVVEGGLVKEWRVYADNKPVYDILARAKSAP